MGGALPGAGYQAFLNTLGVAQYRSGSFRQAGDTHLIEMALNRRGFDPLAEDYPESAERSIQSHRDLPQGPGSMSAGFIVLLEKSHGTRPPGA